MFMLFISGKNTVRIGIQSCAQTKGTYSRAVFILKIDRCTSAVFCVLAALLCSSVQQTLIEAINSSPTRITEITTEIMWTKDQLNHYLSQRHLELSNVLAN